MTWLAVIIIMVITVMYCVMAMPLLLLPAVSALGAPNVPTLDKCLAYSYITVVIGIPVTLIGIAIAILI